jgi:hypothetical protein
MMFVPVLHGVLHAVINTVKTKGFGGEFVIHTPRIPIYGCV